VHKETEQTFIIGLHFAVVSVGFFLLLQALVKTTLLKFRTFLSEKLQNSRHLFKKTERE
jgi:hypothetical protein